MLEMVNKVLNIPENAKCDDILDAIQNGLRATRNVAIDRIEFVQCRQHPYNNPPWLTLPRINIYLNKSMGAGAMGLLVQ